jgi:hypothetical protein
MHRHLWRNNLTFKREREYGPNFLMGHKYMWPLIMCAVASFPTFPSAPSVWGMWLVAWGHL